MTLYTRSKSEGQLPDVGGLALQELAVRTRTDGQASPPPYLWDRGKVFQPATYRVLHGCDTPEFHKRKARGGWLPQTPFLQVETSLTGGLISWRYEKKWDQSYGGGTTTLTGTGQGCLLLPELLGFEQEDQEQVVAKAMADLYASSGFDGLTFALELKDTVRMFHGAFGRLKELLTAYDPSKIGDAYLSARYGMRPLLNDMQVITNSIFGLKQRASEGETFTGQGVITSSVSDTIEAPGSNGGVKSYIIGVWQRNTITSYRARVYSRIKPQELIINIPKTVYEVTRASFVLDWFINVGQWLDTMSAAIHHTDMTAAIGVKTIQTANLVGGRLRRTDGYSGQFNCSGTYTVITTTRMPIAVRIPTTPDVRLNLDLLKVLDLTFMAKQLMKKAPKQRRPKYFKYRPIKHKYQPTIKWTSPSR